MMQQNRFPLEQRINEGLYCIMFLEQDSDEHVGFSEETFVPYEISTDDHPFHDWEGKMVSVRDWLSDTFLHGVSIAHISRIRTMKHTRYGQIEHGVEILGMPIRWFAASHFEKIHY